MPSLSVLLPTLNCREMLPAHLESMAKWQDLAAEILVVDSSSNDGTLEFLREHLKHPNVRFLQHPRGLYQSWNFGISQTKGDWVYISTAGDTVTRGLMEALLQTGENLGVDVVISAPHYIDPDGVVTDTDLPSRRLYRSLGLKEETVRLDGLAGFYYSIDSAPFGALLGSSASNVYRGPHLRAHPFPTGYGTIGDVAWSVQYGFETTFGFIARCDSYFRLHPKAYSAAEYALDMRAIKLFDLAEKTLKELETKNPALAEKARELELPEICARFRRRAHATEMLNACRVGKMFWTLNPRAWKLRRERKEARAAASGLASRAEAAIKLRHAKLFPAG